MTFCCYKQLQRYNDSTICSKNLDFKPTGGTMEFITLIPLVTLLLCMALQLTDPSGYKIHRP